MVPYILTIAAVIVPSLFVKVNKNDKSKKTYLIFIFSVIALLYGLRSHNIGTDTLMYANDYRLIASASWENLEYFRYEYGYTVFNKLLSYISADPQILFIVSGSFICYSFARFIYKNSEDVVLSAFLFITYTSLGIFMNLSRQAIALSIILFGLEALNKNKNLMGAIKFIIFVMIAYMFHRSVIAALFFLIFKLFKINIATTVILICSVIYIYFYFDPIMMAVFDFTSYSYYLDTKFGKEAEFKLANLIVFLSSTLVIILSLIIRPFIKEDNKKNYFDFALLSVIVSLTLYMFAFKINILNRIEKYFDFYYIIIIPIIINKINDSSIKSIIYTLVFALYFIYFLLVFGYGGHSGIYPYKFFWETHVYFY